MLKQGSKEIELPSSQKEKPNRSWEFKTMYSPEEGALLLGSEKYVPVLWSQNEEMSKRSKVDQKKKKKASISEARWAPDSSTGMHVKWYA